MKKLLLAALALLLTIGSTMAQEGKLSGKTKKTPEERSEAFTRKMTKQLSLDQAQQERVKVVNLERFKRIEEAKAATVSNKKEVAAKVKEINEAYNANMKSVLSAEQFSKFMEMKEEMKGRAFKKRQESKG